MKHNSNFQNITENNFLAVNTNTKTYTAIVNRAVSGTFQLTHFAVIQFIMGAQSEHYTGEKSTTELVKLISFLAMYSIELNGITEPLNIELTREQVEMMKRLLEARMKHCEYERDTRSGKFNADTYISQKLLLLDLREWLMCYSIELKEEQVEQPAMH